MPEVIINVEVIANSLLAEAKRGVSTIKKTNLSHPVTIGNMYEGLIKKLISSLLSQSFPFIKLYYTSNSFIRGCQTEYDIIVSTSPGSSVPFTKDQFIHDKETVVAVIQVKSKLTFPLIDSAYENLRGVYNLYDHSSLSEERLKSVNLNISYFIANRFNDLGNTIYGQNFVRAICLNENSPLRVIIGCSGYKYEKTLRRSVIRYFKSRIGRVDFGPVNWPDTLISGDYTLAKMDGKPFYREIIDLDECWWAFYGSTNANPFLVLFSQFYEKLAPEYPQIYKYKYIVPDGIEVSTLFYGRSASDSTAQQMSWMLTHTEKGEP